MKTFDINVIYQEVLSIVIECGDLLVKYYKADNLEITTKADNTRVTTADLAAHELLSQKLQKYNYPIISEENTQEFSFTERQKWSRYWLTDPLDGTERFIKKQDEFAVMLALMENNQPIFGIVYAPILEIAYLGYAGKSFLYDVKQHNYQELLPHKINPTKPLRIALGRDANLDCLKKRLRNDLKYEFIRYGSCGLKGGLLITDQADLYICCGKTSEWDTAAIQVVLQNTQGNIYQLQTRNQLIYNKESFLNPGFIMVADNCFPWQTIFLKT